MVAMLLDRGMAKSSVTRSQWCKTECKLNKQSLITGFKYNVDRAESKSEFGWRIRAVGEHSG